MRARWINQRPAAIFDVCPHLRRRDLENVRQFVPKEDFFICSQPLANLPELVLSAIIFRIGSRCADASASDIARAAAAAPTEKKSARGLELQLLARAAFVEVEGGEGVHMQVSLGAAQRAPRCSAERICAATDFARAALHQNP